MNRFLSHEIFNFKQCIWLHFILLSITVWKMLQIIGFQSHPWMFYACNHCPIYFTQNKFYQTFSDAKASEQIEKISLNCIVVLSRYREEQREIIWEERKRVGVMKNWWKTIGPLANAPTSLIRNWYVWTALGRRKKWHRAKWYRG